jgi:multiple sugar transport system substrate-binding protein
VAYPTADWTWTDFRDAAKKLTDPGTKQFGWAYVNDGSEDTVWRFLALLWQADGDLLSPDNTKAAVNSPAGVKAMQLLYDMAVTDKSVYLDKGDGNYLNLFNSGKIAMLWTGPWDLSSINKDVQYGVDILPADKTHATIAGPDNYVVLDNGPQQVANAWAFIQWFCSPEVHLDYCIATGHLPIRKSETKLPKYGEYLAKYPAAEVFVANLENVTKARPNIATYPKVSAALGQAVQAVLLGKAQPQEALDAAAQQIDAILAAGR